MKMKCKKIEKLISADIDGMLNESDLGILNEHLRDCSVCQLVSENFRVLHNKLHFYTKASQTPNLSDGFDERFFARLEQENVRPYFPKLHHPRLRWMTGFAVSLLVMGLIIFKSVYRERAIVTDLSGKNSAITVAIHALKNEEDIRCADRQAKEILNNFL